MISVNPNSYSNCYRRCNLTYQGLAMVFGRWRCGGQRRWYEKARQSQVLAGTGPPPDQKHSKAREPVAHFSIIFGPLLNHPCYDSSYQTHICVTPSNSSHVDMAMIWQWRHPSTIFWIVWRTTEYDHIRHVRSILLAASLSWQWCPHRRYTEALKVRGDLPRLVSLAKKALQTWNVRCKMVVWSAP